MKDKLTENFAHIKSLFSREQVIVLIVIGALCVGYVFFSIVSLSGTPIRDEKRFEEGKNNLKQFKFDEKAISQLRGLKSEDNTSIKSNITNNRVNPFIQ